jgi:hypothetical protein
MDFELDDVMSMIAEQFGDADISTNSISGGAGKDSASPEPVSEPPIELFVGEEIMRESTHNPQHVIDKKEILQNHISANISSHLPTIRTNMRVYKPRLTRNTISLFEYVAVITKLAKYIHSLPSLPDTVEEFAQDSVTINNIINPSELAWILLKKGVYNPIFDRGYEKVSFSELIINPTWDNLIENYFKSQHAAIQSELLDDMFVGSKM